MRNSNFISDVIKSNSRKIITSNTYSKNIFLPLKMTATLPTNSNPKVIPISSVNNNKKSLEVSNDLKVGVLLLNLGGPASQEVIFEKIS